MSVAPLIGISSYARDGDPASFSLPCDYIDVVRSAGGEPLVLPPGKANLELLLATVDGLVFSGGGDLDPSCYGGRPHETVYMVDEERDRFEISLAAAALAVAALPLLFICRGLQVLNVTRGGTLLPHVPDRYGERVRHRLPPRIPTRHSVRVEPDSTLGRILAVDETEVCSWHHQAVDQVGAGLRAVAWSEDGVIEALEHTDHPWCMAVQWHPEMQAGEEPHRRLFAELVRRARMKRECIAPAAARETKGAI
jgi:putative glutamine amidotransferase